MGGEASAARTTVCGAKQGFRNSPHLSDKKEAPCVDCKCKEQEPDKNGPECTLYPYGSGCCPEGKTPHHLIPKHCFFVGAVKKRISKLPENRGEDCQPYNADRAPCVCLTGRDKSVGQHRAIHVSFDKDEDDHLASTNPREAGEWPYEQALTAALDSVEEVEGLEGCARDCLEAQLNDYHKHTCCISPGMKLKANSHNPAKPFPVPTAKSAGLG